MTPRSLPTARPEADLAALHLGVMGVCLLLVAVIAVLVLRATHGAFVYSLDDPYIHLALARGIANGHYGIDPVAYSAPSSSILWPFLLAPFARSAVAEWLPLAINLACLLGTASLLLRFFARHLEAKAAAFLSLTVVAALNLFGLVFTGMEHSLQLLLVTAVATHIGGLPLPRWQFLTALVLLPLVRYEDLAISLPVLVWHFAAGRRREAATALALMVAALFGFSLFLNQLGLGWLPSSVLAKQAALTASGADRLTVIGSNLIDNLRASPLSVLLVLLACALPASRRAAPGRTAVLVAASGLILLFGRNGWFGRYQVHFAMFVTVVTAASLLPLLDLRKRKRAWLLLTLPVLVFIAAHVKLWKSSVLTPGAAANIAEQQAQMAVIVRDHLRAPVAVNDLGLVAWRGGQPVLDLWGLGSLDALRARQADPSGLWIEPVTALHGVEFAMIYDAWFPTVPARWIRVAELRLAGPRVSAAQSSVSLYATSADAAGRMRHALAAYADSNPLAAQILTLSPPLPAE